MSLADRIAGASPFGPIFGKELRVASRRMRNHILRVAYLGALLLFLLLVYASNSYDGGGVAWRIQQQNRLGQEFFSMFAMFCVIAMGLIAPVLTSTAISSERLGKTLPVLLMTPITSWQIITGKLFSRLLSAMMLIGLSLPVLAVVRLLGGVELWQMAAVICLCTAFALSSAAIGLFYSTLLNRAYAVILLSYATMLLVYLFLPVLTVVAIQNSGMRGRAAWLELLNSTNPVMNVAFIAIPNGPMNRPGWISGTIVQLVLTGMLLMLCALVLRRYARRGGEGSRALLTPPAPPADGGAGEPVLGKPPPLPASLTQAPARGRNTEVGDNPILWREVRQPLITGRWTLAVCCTTIALLLLSYACFASAGILDEEELQIAYAFGFNGFYWLLIAVLSATAIAQEKESDTWTVLLVSPISARQVVLGKLLGLLRRLVWPTLLIAIHFGLFTVSGVISLATFLVVAWVVLTFNTVWAALGLYLSLRLRKVTTAVVVNLIVPLVLFAGVPLLLVALDELARGRDALGEWTLWYLPYYHLATAVESLSPGFDPWRQIRMPGYRSNVSIHEYLRFIVLAGLVHVSIAGLIVWRTIAGFDRIVERSPQSEQSHPST